MLEMMLLTLVFMMWQHCCLLFASSVGSANVYGAINLLHLLSYERIGILT
jgi:hypothetical protein